MKKEDLDKLKEAPPSTPHGALAKLWRNILIENKLTAQIFYLATKYVNNSKLLPNAKSIKKKTRASLVSSITESNMTWKKLTFLLFDVMKVKKVTFSAVIHHRNDKVTSHSVIMVNGNDVNNNPEDKKDE